MVNTQFIIIILIFSILVYISIDSFLKYKRRQSYVDKHEQYINVLTYYLEKSFDIIYKDRILVYSIEGTKPSEEVVKQNSIDFAKLALQLLGKTLTKEFIFLYGDEKTFMLIIVEYFNTKAEHDEIKQASMDQIMEGTKNEII